MTRLFYASERSPTTSAVRSEIWRDNLYRSLVQVVGDVVEFQYDLDEVSRRVCRPDIGAGTLETLRRAVAGELARQLAAARFAKRSQHPADSGSPSGHR